MDKNSGLQFSTGGRHSIAHAQSPRTTILGSRASLLTSLTLSPSHYRTRFTIPSKVTPSSQNCLVGGQSTQPKCLSLLKTRLLRFKGSIPITDRCCTDPPMRFAASFVYFFHSSVFEVWQKAWKRVYLIFFEEHFNWYSQKSEFE